MDAEEDGLGAIVDADAAAANGSPGKPTISSEQMDVEAYAGLYSGRTKVTGCCSSPAGVGTPGCRSRPSAWRTTRSGRGRTLSSTARSSRRSVAAWGRSTRWIRRGSTRSTAARSCARRSSRTSSTATGFLFEIILIKTNLIKESIRMGYNDFGDFYYAHGNLGEAFKNYVRTRDYCTTSKHIIQMCLNVILVSHELGQFMHVLNYVSKAEQTPDLHDPVTLAKLRCAAGLAFLETKQYKLAARKFLETGPELGNNYTEVIAPQYIAIYGGLCALASFDRTELKNKVIDNINFRSFLELVPEGNSFMTLCKVLIDSHNKIMYARHADHRNATFQRVLQTDIEFDRDVRAMLLRANLLKHEHNLRASRKL